MGKTGLYIIIAVLFIGLSPFASDALEPNDTVSRYLHALKQGDIGTIKDSIAGELYNKRKVLLEQNKSYPKFLKKTYREAEFQIRETTFNNNDVLVEVEVKFPKGKTKFILYLSKNAQGNWKIFEESVIP